MRDSFIFYRSFYEGIRLLPPEERLKAYDALAEYALNDKEPEEQGMFAIVFHLAKPQIDANKQRHDNGKKGGRPKKKTDDFEEEKPMVSENKNQRLPKTKTTGYPIEKPNENVNENVNVNYKEKGFPLGNPKKKGAGAPAPRFKPPTVEEVREFCDGNGYKVDAERFVDFYEAKGWMVGKNKMKDWKAAVRNWSRSERQGMAAKPKNDFHNFPQRDIDYEKLEEDLDRQFMEEWG